MNWKILVSVAILSFGFVAFLGYVNCESDPDTLFADLVKQMQEGEFEEIYENSTSLIHLNADKEKFTERMTNALEKMKKIDSKLNFRRDKEAEIGIENSNEIDRAASRDSPYTHTTIIEKLGSGDDEVTVVAFFDNKRFFPKFSDLAILPLKSERQDLRVKGIAYKK